MNKSMLKNIIILTLPVIVYIMADSFIKNETISLIIAVCTSLIEFIISAAVYKKVDLFIFFDLILISIMAVISIVFKNPVFFKLKPAVIELILFIFMMPLCFSVRFLSGYLNRYLKDIRLDDRKLKLMQRNVFLIELLVLIHIILIVVSAVYFAREVWAFVSGILLYILFGTVFLFTFLYRRLHDRYILNKYKNGD